MKRIVSRKSLWSALLLLGVGVLSMFSQRPGHTSPVKNDSNSQTPTPTAHAEPASSETSDKLIVHEWGTFTSFSGSDGVRLEFRPLFDNDLPGFVLNRAEQEGAYNDFSKVRMAVRERMETPVTYFSTDREREVQVKVGFPKGLLTEFYPPVQKMLPAFEREKVVPIRDSLLDWGTVRLIPEAKLRTGIADERLASVVQKRLIDAIIPPARGDHYAFARETDSAIVHTRLAADPKKVDAPQGDFFEKFLFYRGIGNFKLPIQVQANGGGQFAVSNQGAEPIRSLFLVTVEGSTLRFTFAPRIEAQGRLNLVQSAKKSSIDELAQAVVQSLVAEQLYTKEAQAMVNTWRTSWFGEQGTRLFYMVPGRLTDELLPLTVSPQPDETVRVLVGRYEIMSPEDEARVTDMVRRSIASRAAFHEKAKNDDKLREQGYPLPQDLWDLGRLSEPALVRVKAIAKDPAVRQEAASLLSQYIARRAKDE